MGTLKLVMGWPWFHLCTLTPLPCRSLDQEGTKACRPSKEEPGSKAGQSLKTAEGCPSPWPLGPSSQRVACLWVSKHGLCPHGGATTWLGNQDHPKQAEITGTTARPAPSSLWIPPGSMLTADPSVCGSELRLEESWLKPPLCNHPARWPSKSRSPDEQFWSHHKHPVSPGVYQALAVGRQHLLPGCLPHQALRMRSGISPHGDADTPILWTVTTAQ